MNVDKEQMRQMVRDALDAGGEVVMMVINDPVKNVSRVIADASFINGPFGFGEMCCWILATTCEYSKGELDFAKSIPTFVEGFTKEANEQGVSMRTMTWPSKQEH